MMIMQGFVAPLSILAAVIVVVNAQACTSACAVGVGTACDPVTNPCCDASLTCQGTCQGRPSATLVSVVQPWDGSEIFQQQPRYNHRNANSYVARVFPSGYESPSFGLFQSNAVNSGNEACCNVQVCTVAGTTQCDPVTKPCCDARLACVAGMCQGTPSAPMLSFPQPWTENEIFQVLPRIEVANVNQYQANVFPAGFETPTFSIFQQHAILIGTEASCMGTTIGATSVQPTATASSTSASSSPSTTTPSTAASGLSRGAIAGIVIGTIFLVALIGVGIALLIRQRSSHYNPFEHRSFFDNDSSRTGYVAMNDT